MIKNTEKEQNNQIMKSIQDILNKILDKEKEY